MNFPVAGDLVVSLKTGFVYKVVRYWNHSGTVVVERENPEYVDYLSILTVTDLHTALELNIELHDFRGLLNDTL